jgi:beta-galactosidase
MQNHWQQYTLPLDNIAEVDFAGEYKVGTPAFYRFAFEVDECCDTFLDFEGWGKGCVFVNGFNIGRYFNSAGPQKTLYVPAPLLKTGANQIIVFETDGFDSATITFTDTPDLG